MAVGGTRVLNDKINIRCSKQKETIIKQRKLIAELKQMNRDLKRQYKEMLKIGHEIGLLHNKQLQEARDRNFSAVQELARIQNVPIQDYRGIGR